MESDLAISYFQAVVILLIFFFGVPSIVYQTAISVDVRKIIKKHIWRMLWHYLIYAVILIAIAFCFVWHSYLYQNNQEISKDQFSGFLISVAIILTVWGWILQIYRLAKEMIVKKLEKYIINNRKLSSERKVKDLEESLNDLVYLGEKAKKGLEKEIIIKSLERIIENRQKKGDYRGDELRDVIDGLVRIAITGNNKNYDDDEKSDENNIYDCIEILGNTIKKAEKEGKSETQDAMSAKRGIEEIVKDNMYKLNEKTRNMAISYLSKESNHLFRIGMKAVEEKKTVVALMSLFKMEDQMDMEDRTEEKKKEDEARLSGLLATIMSMGKAEKEKIRQLKEENTLMRETLEKESLIEARTKLITLGEYEAANKVADMIEEME